MYLFYYLCVLIMKGLLLAFSRYSILGRQNVPRSGPLIVVSNHLNNADPPLVAACLPRRVAFMTKEEIFRHPLLRMVALWYGCFPVRRGVADRAALRKALSLLQKGVAVGMFPEGSRSHGEGLRPAQPGIGLVALRSGAPICPVAITGTEKVTSLFSPLRRPRITVRIGRPFLLPEQVRRQGAKAATEHIMRQVAALLPPAYRGVYEAASSAEAQEGEMGVLAAAGG